jgi:DNA-binding IclR family transcriptional regulator
MPRPPSSPSLADQHGAPGGVAAVDRAATLLAAFRRGDTSLSLTELATRTGLYKSTTMRLLASLEHAGLIRKLDDGSYALGAEIARLHAVNAASFSLEQVVMPVLRELVADTGESAAYHVSQGTARLCLYRVDSPNPIRDHTRAGELLPIDQGAGGRVLIAFDETLARKYGKGKDAPLYESIRQQGYCAVQGDRLAEVAGISAPVFHQDGSLAAALTLIVPAHRYDERHIEPTLRAAHKLSTLV